MGKHSLIGEFEQMVLLALLRLGNAAYAVAVIAELEAQTGRSVSRGALYRTLDRLEAKQYLEWALEETTPTRGGHPRRVFSVTEEGVATLQASRSALLRLWSGLETVLEP